MKRDREGWREKRKGETERRTVSEWQEVEAVNYRLSVSEQQGGIERSLTVFLFFMCGGGSWEGLEYFEKKGSLRERKDGAGASSGSRICSGVVDLSTPKLVQPP
jgi:hypothetical protein